MNGQWQPPPVVPMNQQQMGYSPAEQGMYAQEHRSLSGQWYPQQQAPQQLDSGEVMELPGHGHEQLHQGQYNQGLPGQQHWAQGQRYGGQRY